MEAANIRLNRLVVYGCVLTFISICFISRAIWLWPAGESFLRDAAGGNSLLDFKNPLHKLPPPVPSGPPTKVYLEHSSLDVDYYLALDTKKGYLNFENATTSDCMAWGSRVLYYRNAWLSRVQDFRRELSREGLNNVDFNISLENALFRQKPVSSSVQNKYTYEPRTNTAGSFDDDILEEVPSIDRFKNCLSDPMNCGEINVPPVVNITLILPLNAVRYNNTWPTLESLRQLVVFPSEVIFVISNFAAVENKLHIFSLINIVNEVYRPSLPDAVSFKVFLSHKKHHAGESRWFGVNQSEAGSIATVFDADDYMHPQLVQFMWEVFTRRPELDYALMQYHGGMVEGEYHGDSYYHKIFEFLNEHHYSPSWIREMAEYSDNAYNEVRKLVPTWDKKWYLGNTDAEPNWGNEKQKWWDYGCHNGWQVMRRDVMDVVQPPTMCTGGEDAIFNYRVIMAGLNYKCFPVFLGLYIQCFCDALDQNLWTIDDLKQEEKARKGASESVVQSQRRVDDSNVSRRQVMAAAAELLTSQYEGGVSKAKIDELKKAGYNDKAAPIPQSAFRKRLTEP